MSGIKYYALRDGEELPEEFVVIRHIDGEPKFIASYINTNYLDYENGVLLKMHERNDVLRAENAKLRQQCAEMWEAIKTRKRVNFATILRFCERLRKLGVIE